MSQELNILEINPGLMFWTIVTFVILFLALKKLAWRPILGALENREKTIRDSLEEAATNREEAQRLLTEHGRKLEEIGSEAQKLLEEGRNLGEKMKKEILARAREEAEEVLNRGKHEISLEKDRAVEEIRRNAVDLSIAAASKLVRKNLDEEDHKRIVLEAINDLEEMK